MAQNQRESNRLRHIIEEKDREIEMLKDNENYSGKMDPGVTAGLSLRVLELEGMVKGLAEGSGRMDAKNAQGLSQRVNQLEGMVKGLTEELLDLKAEVRKIVNVLEGKEELKPKPEIRHARSATERIVRRPEESPRRESQHVEANRPTANIMQPDGSIAEEPRESHDLIIAGNRSASDYESRPKREYRGKEEKKPLIYADENDTIELKKK